MIDGAASTRIPARGKHTLTATLGCTHTTVESMQVTPQDPLDLDPVDDQLVVPIEAAESLQLDDAVTIPSSGVGFVPAGVSARLDSVVATTVVVVGAASESVGAGPAVVDLSDHPFPEPSTSDVGTAHLTDPLGCTGMKVNARILHPAQHVPYHTEGTQEELFVPVQGPASMLIAGEAIDTPVGTVTRVAPAVPRSALNPGETDAIWVMVGAPPTGGPDDWDPGATILE